MVKSRKSKRTSNPVPKTQQAINKQPLGTNVWSDRGPMSMLHPMFDSSVDTSNHFTRSVVRGQRVEIDQLRRLANIPPVRKAIRRIGNGVIAMPWTVTPPIDKRSEKTALARAEIIKQSLLRPVDRGNHNTYSKLIRSIVQEILITGCAAVERCQSPTKDRSFYLWDADVKYLHFNREWNDNSPPNVPRYWSYLPNTKQYTEIYNEDLFLITYDCNSYQLVPPGPMEIAYQSISAWLGLSEFQNNTTANAIRENLLVFKGVSVEELTAFRQYWKSQVVMQGDIPSISSEDTSMDVNVLKVGARNDDELYPKFTEYLLKIIAICFDLSSRDYNLTDHDNRATAGFAADSTFADAVLPMAYLIRDSLWLEVVDLYEPGFKFNYTDTEPRSQSDEASTANTLYAGNLITRNEARQRVGHELVGPGGDTFADGKSIDESLKDTEEEQTKQDAVSTEEEESEFKWW
jgi:hypothetical protein